jgi:hypothetical protein
VRLVFLGAPLASIAFISAGGLPISIEKAMRLFTAVIHSSKCGYIGRGVADPWGGSTEQ